MGSRKWFKVYADKWLEGTMRDETPDIRGIFVDLLALAASGKYGDIGVIALQNGVGLTDSQVENLLKLTKFQWRKAKNRLILTERIAVNSANVVTIINWKKFQSEYERQKPYRHQELQPRVTTESYTGEREKDKGEREVVTSERPYQVVNP
jgi:hypothetical protein